ncbi:MAG: S49 family peptidase [Rhabdochlamydiaceae bacterium]|nr:S49 family peptidase [Rhabdochlamydiaceae bacterium]
MNFKKESVFVNAVRSFLSCFAAILGILIGISVFFIGLKLISTPIIPPDKCDVFVAADANGKRDILPDSAPVILKIDIKGIIGQGDLTFEKIQTVLWDSREGTLQQGRVKAILLNINSPGGVASDADGIYRALLAYKEKYQVPIYAFVENLCASGGMYIACAADKIYASETSIIGSVGVILGPNFNVSNLMDRYGVQALSITEGKDKDMLSPFRPWVPGEDASIRAITADLYETFVSVVTSNRPKLDKAKLINEYGAQIFATKKAQELGYIDVADTNYYTVMTDLVNAAGLKDPNFYQVLQLQVPHSFIAALSESKLSLLQGKITHQFQFSPYMNSELSGKFLYLYQP